MKSLKGEKLLIEVLKVKARFKSRNCQRLFAKSKSPLSPRTRMLLIRLQGSIIRSMKKIKKITKAANPRKTRKNPQKTMMTMLTMIRLSLR